MPAVRRTVVGWGSGENTHPPSPEPMLSTVLSSHSPVQLQHPLLGHDLLPVLAEAVFPQRCQAQGHARHGVQCLIVEIFGQVARQMDVVLGHHSPEFLDPFRIDIFQVVEGDAAADAVVGAEYEGEAVGQGVAGPHLGVGNGHAAEV